MKVIYVAGPYMAKTEWELVQNIREAEAVAIQIWQAGGAAICPHKNTAHLGGLCPEHRWLDGYIEILRRCDACAITPRWQESKGAVAEVDFANANGIPVLFTIEDILNFLADTLV